MYYHTKSFKASFFSSIKILKYHSQLNCSVVISLQGRVILKKVMIIGSPGSGKSTLDI